MNEISRPIFESAKSHFLKELARQNLRRFPIKDSVLEEFFEQAEQERPDTLSLFPELRCEVESVWREQQAKGELREEDLVSIADQALARQHQRHPELMAKVQKFLVIETATRFMEKCSERLVRDGYAVKLANGNYQIVARRCGRSPVKRRGRR